MSIGKYVDIAALFLSARKVCLKSKKLCEGVECQVFIRLVPTGVERRLHIVVDKKMTYNL